MLRLITDCDGPIMDVSERYYQVYCYCLDQVKEPEQVLHRLSKADFWQRKRGKIPETQIGLDSGLTPTQVDSFALLRKQTVHTMPYLPYDLPLPGVEPVLQSVLDRGIDLVIMTMRRVRELDEALDRNQLTHFFPDDRRYCLDNEYVKTGDTNDKPLLMERAMAELPAAEGTWMVGDTEADILAAQRVGIPAIAVLSGIRDQEQLERYQPDYIVENLAAAVDLFCRHHGVN
jgi:phosphoglycolate phosphatase-like HAD superfamily hydrolase